MDGLYNPTVQITEFQKQSAAVALNEMFKDRSFSICDFDKIAKVLRIIPRPSGPDYDALSALHCVAWGEMPPALQENAKRKILELLFLQDIIDVKTVEEPPPRRKKSFLKMLMGGG